MFEGLQYQTELNQVKPLLELYQKIYSELTVIGEPLQGENFSSNQMAQLERTLDLYEQIHFNSISSLEALNLTRVQSSPNVVQVEPATVPGSPYSPRHYQTATLCGAVGLLGMACIAFLVEFLDDTIKTPEEVKEVLGLPVIGLVADMKGEYSKRNTEKKKFFVANQPRSPIAEAFRSIRTSLEFFSVDDPLKMLVITSAGPEEGKTTIVSNLAAIIAKGNKRVLLLYADLRHPNVHMNLNISNRIELSDLILGRLPMEEVVQQSEEDDNLHVITSGSLPPNPAELLASEKMNKIIKKFRSQYDMILIDTPPAIVTDAQILASKADGVIYVIRPGKTRSVTARTPLEEFECVDANMIGVVMNRIPRNRSYYYGGFDYYAPNASISDKYYRSGKNN